MDLISREEALKQIDLSEHWLDAKNRISDLPTIQPKKGEWIEHEYKALREQGYYRCSKCGVGFKRFDIGIRESDVPYINGKPYKLHNIDNYCPNCGADMRGDKE